MSDIESIRNSIKEESNRLRRKAAINELWKEPIEAFLRQAHEELGLPPIERKYEFSTGEFMGEFEFSHVKFRVSTNKNNPLDTIGAYVSLSSLQVKCDAHYFYFVNGRWCERIPSTWWRKERYTPLTVEAYGKAIHTILESQR